MRFMLTTIPSPKYRGQPPRPELLAAIGRLTEEMTRAGVLLETGGMGRPLPQIELAEGKIHLTDGPYAEAKEVIGGYAMVQVASLEEAIALTKRFLDVHREILGADYASTNEIVRLYGPWDGVPLPCEMPA